MGFPWNINYFKFFIRFFIVFLNYARKVYFRWHRYCILLQTLTLTGVHGDICFHDVLCSKHPISSNTNYWYSFHLLTDMSFQNIVFDVLKCVHNDNGAMKTKNSCLWIKVYLISEIRYKCSYSDIRAFSHRLVWLKFSTVLRVENSLTYYSVG